MCDHVVAYVYRRYGQLYQLEKEWANGVKITLCSRTPVARVAMLSFLGVSDRVLKLLGGKWALALLVAGTILVGIENVRTYHPMSDLFEGWKRSSSYFVEDKIEWEYVTTKDSARVQQGRQMDDWIVCNSLGCFILGSVVGASGLFA
jgi:hypothetical protein